MISLSAKLPEIRFMAGNKYWLLSSVVGCCLNTNVVYGQIVPDNTTNTTITNSCQVSCDITGGIIAGDNLFHSFTEFNLNNEESVYFADPGVNNIFSRITGSNPSEIFGTLGISGGDASLWLLNPNGIVFGQGATLDINGSFVATTADEIRFGDRNFTALPNDQENFTLLTIEPTALFFNQMGQNLPINLNSGATLEVSEQETITLVGGQEIADKPAVEILDASLQASQGNIFIAGIENSGQINLDNDFQLTFNPEVIKGDIIFDQGSVIDVSGIGAGSIKLQGRSITLTGESQLNANTLGNLNGKEIDITANELNIADNSTIITSTIGTGNSANIIITTDESVDLSGRDITAFQEFLLTTLTGGDRSNNISSFIYSFSQGDGIAGDINIKSENVMVQNGAWILTSSLNSGHAGDIAIDAKNDLTINGSGLISGSAVDSEGNSGKITINSENLLIQNSGLIFSGTLGLGNGGDISLNISDSIILNQSLSGSIVPTGVYTNTVGNSGAAGNLTIDTDNLIIDDGSQLSSASGTVTSQGLIPFGGKGGNITVSAKLIDIQGSSPDDLLASGIINDTYSNNSAGDILIQTDKLNLSENASISASSINSGNGGNLSIFANESINLQGLGFENLQQVFLGTLSGEVSVNDLGGGLLTNNRNGIGGNITIESPRLILEEGALISSSTFGLGNGGNLDIESENIQIIDSAIVGSTLSQGTAGNLNIQTDQLSLLNGVLVTSSIGLSDAGNIKVQATESIDLVGDNSSFISPGIYTANTNGHPGNLEVNTKDLVIRGGARIDASSGESNIQEIQDILEDIDDSGQEVNLDTKTSLIINAESIKISGTSMNGFFSSNINTSTGSSFPASDIQINSSQLEISDQGEIAVSSFGDGEAGSLTINSDTILLRDQGSLNASSLSGQGGNIELQVKDLLSLYDNSNIQTDAQGFGNGGNIAIDTTFVILSEISRISAQALSGQGGSINIAVTDIFVTPSSQISASSDLGIDGEVNIQTFSSTERNNSIKLPEKTVQADNLVVQSCGSSNAEGAFLYTGKGGLPINLLTEVLEGDTISDLDIPNNLTIDNPLQVDYTTMNLQSLIIAEAQSWKINLQGKVELITSDNSSLSALQFPSLSCF